MTGWALFFLAIGLAMDAFAVAVSLGLAMRGFSWRSAGIVGGYFGVFQGLMPLAGYFAAFWFAGAFDTFGHWLVFALLVLLGGKMIVGAHKEEEVGAVALTLRVMLPFALATSLDALAVGVSLAVLDVHIWGAAALIGVITFAISAVGVKIGAVFGARYKAKAAIAGGIILIFIGLRVMLEGLAG